ncbi:hypothetical protein RchiOBHm_Chr4g0398771 [Rosa chinensis]|uniref:Uncharacterized protein n=1 Tax=Rosa chinensis TaxID=74649 RepID=A0A2P6QSD1_ROSCH|nr:hypothetical protein RchiOBHm_Chr4g0398771 [Rosa chinensis]
MLVRYQNCLEQKMLELCFACEVCAGLCFPCLNDCSLVLDVQHSRILLFLFLQCTFVVNDLSVTLEHSFVVA